MKRWSLLLLCVAPWLAQADTIYLCKAYSGGMFWSSVPCSQKQATVDRMVSMPNDIPWDQKVALGEAARSQGQAIAAQQQQPVVVMQSAQSARHAECANLLATIATFSNQSGVRRTGQTQDQQREYLERLEERRRRLQC